MPDFRCIMLDERGAILFPSDITAENQTSLSCTPPTFSTRATGPRRRDRYTHSKYGPARAGCSLRSVNSLSATFEGRSLRRGRGMAHLPRGICQQSRSLC